MAQSMTTPTDAELAALKAQHTRWTELMRLKDVPPPTVAMGVRWNDEVDALGEAFADVLPSLLALVDALKAENASLKADVERYEGMTLQRRQPSFDELLDEVNGLKARVRKTQGG